jgi:hypothetical protein
MRKALLILLITGLFIFAGCNSNQEEGPNSGDPYIGGTQGLAISFPQGMPPAEIYDAGQGAFSIGVLMENVGESAVGLNSRNQYGHIKIIGINAKNFNVDAGQANFDDLFVTFEEAEVELGYARRGFDGSIITGDSTLVTFDTLSYLPDLRGNNPVTIRANVCYEYRTYTRAEVCIKDNLLERAQDDAICALSGARNFAGSGGPVQVTNVVQNPAGSSKIQVTFTIENLGNGEVYAPYSLSNAPELVCASSRGANTQRDVVNVEVTLGDEFTTEYIVECPQMGGISVGQIRMYQGAPAVVTCTIDNIDVSAGRIFTENLNIDLFYTYQQYVQQPMLIRDTNVGTVEQQ